jgi:hypothetical protein
MRMPTESMPKDVRYKANEDANIVGTLKLGDTVCSKKAYNSWRIIRYKHQMFYVDSSYLTKLIKPKYKPLYSDEMSKSGKYCIGLINKYGHWKSGKFWLITAGMLFVALILFLIGANMIRGSYAVELWVEKDFMGMNYLPYIAVSVGVLFGFVYFFWPRDVQLAIFIQPFWWLPGGTGFLAWYLWLLAAISALSIFIFAIYDLRIFRGFAFVRIPYFLFISAYIFVSMIFFARASVVVLIFVAIVIIGIQFIAASATASAPSSRSQRDDEQREVRKRQEKEEAYQLYRNQKIEREFNQKHFGHD